MLILYDQLLYLVLLFLSGRSSHPLLAINTSVKPSKPFTSLCINKLIITYYLKNNVKNVIDKCVELIKAVKGLNAEEYEILIASLERSLEEIK